MKERIVKTLKISLLILAICLAILMIFGFVLWLGWPLWAGLFLMAGFVALVLGILFARKLFLRRKERRFVQQVIEQDEARAKTMSARERDELKTLQQRWKEAVDMLRHSHLKKQGNPLYVLPWYMVIGESGSGKTTAINSARLSSPFTEVSRVQGISGTKNCDWWFFEQAIIIDTAGRYAIPVDEGRDKDEWQKFLTLLVKYRKKEPLQGLIVTIAVDKLLGAPQKVLEEDGRSIRRRVDELMRVLGVKFPVYVLVTKCDLVQGMKQYSDQLPEKALDQPMGYINESLTKDIDTFLKGAMHAIGERLKNVRLLLLNKPQSKSLDPVVLLFPDEFGQLSFKLDLFMKAVFQENPYQETPILRGLFFSSGRQEGTPYSHFLEALGLIDKNEVHSVSNKGLFLHEFFSRVLPTDRRLFAPTTRALQWQALTRNLGLVAWIFFGTALCGLLSLSFVKNLNAIRWVTNEIRHPIVVNGQFLPDMSMMGRLRETLFVLEDKNHGWWIPRFGLTESLEAEYALKEKYCSQFRDSFLTPFDRYAQGFVPQLAASSSSPDEIVGQYVVYFVRRINLLQMRLKEAKIEDLNKMPQPYYVFLTAEQTLEPEVRKKFGGLYLSYVLWRTDTGEINKEVGVLQTWLKELLVSRGTNIRWLILWVDKESGLNPVRLVDFWGGSRNLSDEPYVNPAFTKKGKSMMDGFMAELRNALPDSSLAEAQKANLEKQYRSLCFESWHVFAAYFPKGAERLKGAREWKLMAPRMATEKGPYPSLIEKIATEIQPAVLTGDETPQWLQQIYQLQLAKSQKYVAGQGTVTKATDRARSFVGSIGRRITNQTQTPGQTNVIETQLAIGKTYQEMTSALASILPTLASRSQTFQLAAQVFTEDPASSKSPFYLANGAASKLKAYLGRSAAIDPDVSEIISGPVDFLWKVVRMEASCELQSAWEEKVLAEAQGVNSQEAAQVLLAPEGPVWKFIKGGGTATPFMGWNLQRGYFAKEALGGGIMFDPSFYAFLKKGNKAAVAAKQPKQNTSVTITGLPTDVNPEAKLKPHSTKLEIQCANGAQTLVNMNYPVKKTFTWTPDGCADVLFQIEVGDLILRKTYGGSAAFADFLKDFRGGKRTFQIGEFPSQKSALEVLGIKTITVNYHFSGESQQVIGQSTIVPSIVARTISRCWAAD